MYLIPFFQQKETGLSGIMIIKVCIFLSHGGTALLEGFEATEVNSFCQENGFVSKRVFQKGEHIFIEIDSKKTDISSFYTFEEAFKTQNECWRTFVLAYSEGKDSWNVNCLFQGTPFSNVLEEIMKAV